MPYRSNVNSRDKAGASAAVAAIHLALLFAFLNLAGKMPEQAAQSALRLFDLSKPPEPPPPPPQRVVSRLEQKAGGSSPKNIRSQATPVVAPKPIVLLPPVQHITASATRTNRRRCIRSYGLPPTATAANAPMPTPIAIPVSSVRRVS